MDKTKYIIIGRNEDEPFTQSVSKEELTKNLAEKYWGDVQFLTECPDLDEFPANSLFIIKGESVVPVPKKVVEVYEVN